MGSFRPRRIKSIARTIMCFSDFDRVERLNIIGARNLRTVQFSASQVEPFPPTRGIHKASQRLLNRIYPILDTSPPTMSYLSLSTSESYLQSTERIAQDTTGGESQLQRYVHSTVMLISLRVNTAHGQQTT